VQSRDGAVAGDGEVPAGVETGDLGDGLDRWCAAQPEGVADILGVHDDLAQPCGGVARCCRGAGDGVTEALESLCGCRAAVLNEAALVVQVEVESCAQDAPQPAQAADAGRGAEVGDDLLDHPELA